MREKKRAQREAVRRRDFYALINFDPKANLSRFEEAYQGLQGILVLGHRQKT